MPTLINIRGIGESRHDASKFAKLELYLPSYTRTALIEREFYIVDDLAAKVLIGVDILKPKGIVIDLDKNIIIIRLYQDLEVLINVSSKGSRINATVFS